jgi:hypothetical protein
LGRRRSEFPVTPDYVEIAVDNDKAQNQVNEHLEYFTETPNK